MAVNQTINTSSLDAISKEVFPFDDQIWVLYDRKTPAMDLIDSSKVVPFQGNMSSDGKYWVFPVATDGSANPAVATSENSGLPESGRTETIQVQYNRSTHFQAMHLTGDVIDTMIGGQYSVQDGLEFQMRNQPLDARKRFNYFIHRDGSGSLGTPSSVTISGNTITFSSSIEGIIKAGTQFVLKHKTTGALYANGHPASGTALECTAVDSTGLIATVTDENGTAISWTATDTPTNYEAYAYPGAQGGAINGFGIMVSDANPTNWGSATAYFGNVNRSTNPLWKGYRLNANSGTISVQNHIQPFIDTVRRRSGEFLREGGQDGTTWYAFTGYQNMRTIGNALKADQRTAPNYAMLKGGWKGVEYEGAMFVIDDDAPPSTIRFIHPGSCRRFVIKPWFWDDRTGSIWKRATATDGRDADAFKAYMYTRQQMISIRCRTMGEIYGTSATS